MLFLLMRKTFFFLVFKVKLFMFRITIFYTSRGIKPDKNPPKIVFFLDWFGLFKKSNDGCIMPIRN